jgi:DNA-binding beta-propeller fold protein YncE
MTRATETLSSRGAARLLAVAALALAAMLCSASSALAARSFESQLTEANGSPLKKPAGLAVDGSGDVWVSDTGTALVSKFDPSGNYLAQSDGTEAWNGSQFVQDLAFAKTSGLIYAADSNFDDLWSLHLDATPAGIDFFGGGWDTGAHHGCCYLRARVDNSGGATDGDIYVAGNGAVTRLDAAGNPAEFSGSASYIEGNKITGTPEHGFGFGSSAAPLALDASGNIYVANNDDNNATHEVDEFDPTGTFVQAFTGGFGHISALAVDPTNGEVLIADREQHVVHVFESGGDFLEDLSGEDTPDPSFSPQALAVSSTGTLYVADEAEPVVDVFHAAGPPPPRHPIAIQEEGTGTGTVTSTPSGLHCAPGCTHNFDDNTTVTLSAAPNPHNTFKGWILDGDPNACPGTGDCEVEVGTEAHTVIASFEEDPHDALTVTSEAGGSVRGPGVECPSDCGQEFWQGTEIALSAHPAVGHHFLGWSGDCSGTGECALTMDAAHEVTAAFAIDAHALAVAKAGAGAGTVTSDVGKIDCGTTCSDSYDYGTVVTLTASAEAGSTFTGFSGACTGTGPCRVTVDAAKQVTATFVPTPPPPAETGGTPPPPPAPPTFEAPGLRGFVPYLTIPQLEAKEPRAETHSTPPHHGNAKKLKLKQALRRCHKKHGRARRACERRAR